MTKIPDLDHLAYLRRAYEYAARHSQDPSTQNAALLIAQNCGDLDGGILLSESNHFPFGVAESDERWQRPIKYSFVEHAERNAIYAAARMGLPTVGLGLYCPWFACTDCARAIVQSGIAWVVGHDADLHKKRPDWAESLRVAEEILAEGGVSILRIPGSFDGVEIRFDGQLVTPH